MARVFGCLGRSLSWERALTGVAEDEVAEFGDAVAGWVIEFGDRFDTLTR